MMMVSTLNGKISKNNDPDIYKWTSKADQAYFFAYLKKNNLIVIGSKTYDSARNIIQLSKRQLRIVLTRNPQKYKSDAVPGQLEFTSESPKELVKRLCQKSYKKLLLVGGSNTNTLFLMNGLVDEIFLTIEPEIFGQGKLFILEKSLEVSLKLLSFIKLNQQGTLLLHYQIKKQ